MISRIEDIPALTRAWLAPLAASDPARHAELARDVEIASPPPQPVDARLLGPAHADVAAVLAVLDLAGKEIGGFRFAPVDGATVIDRLTAFNQVAARHFGVEGDVLFVGDYVSSWVVSTPGDLGLLQDNGEMQPLARDFGSFLVAQANAFDAFHRHILNGREDEAAYRAEALAAATDPALAKANVPLIYESQLKA
jgi:hypothetical protein